MSLGDAAPDGVCDKEAAPPFVPSDGGEGELPSLASAAAPPLLIAGAGAAGAPSAAWRRSAMRDAHATMASVSAGLPASVGANVAGAACEAARLARWERTLPGSHSRAVRSERRKVGKVWRASADAGGDERPLPGWDGGAGGVSSAAEGADPGCDEAEDVEVEETAVMAAGVDGLACESKLVAGDDAAPLNDTLDALEVDRTVESGGRSGPATAAARSGACGCGCSGIHSTRRCGWCR